jgi:hypothetical protein
VGKYLSLWITHRLTSISVISDFSNINIEVPWFAPELAGSAFVRLSDSQIGMPHENSPVCIGLEFHDGS